jgi:hypothetical protein
MKPNPSATLQDYLDAGLGLGAMLSFFYMAFWLLQAAPGLAVEYQVPTIRLIPIGFVLLGALFLGEPCGNAIRKPFLSRETST